MNTDDLSSLAQLKKFLQGPQGIHGLEGRCPMHVQESKPTVEVEKGDLWYQPSTEKLRLYTGTSWKEIAKQGIMGLEGRDGKDGKPGPKGDKGEPGPAGKDADTAEMYDIAVKKVISHEVKYNHEHIHDPHLLGTKIVSEAGLVDGMILQYDAKSNRLIYVKPKFGQTVVQQGGRGLSLPSRAGNGGKFLTTDGTVVYWAPATGSFVDKEVPTGAIDDSNTTFTLANTPVSGSDHWYLNGVLQNAGASNDYTLSGATATFNTAPPTGSVLLVTYRT